MSKLRAPRMRPRKAASGASLKLRVNEGCGPTNRARMLSAKAKTVAKTVARTLARVMLRAAAKDLSNLLAKVAAAVEVKAKLPVLAKGRFQVQGLATQACRMQNACAR